MRFERPSRRRVVAVSLLTVVLWACSGDAADGAGNTLIDLGNKLRDSGGDHAAAQEPPCQQWSVQLFLVDDPRGTRNQPIEVPAGWQPFAVNRTPADAEVYLRRCDD